MKENAKSTDLGEGSVGKLLFRLAIPAVISQLVNVLYNIVDRMYIGHIPVIGGDALTGLGICFPVLMIVAAFSSLFCMGGAPKAAIAMGKGDNSLADRYLGNCVSALLVAAIVLTFVLQVFGRDILFSFGASENTIVYAWSYLQIYALGTIFVQIAVGLNMFITTQGFAKYSMITVLIGAILNIILDPIFIFVFDLGVRGAAIATILSQCVSAMWVLRFLLGKRTVLKIRKENLKIDPKILLPVMALGIAPFIMQATESLLNVCFNVSLAKYGGDIAVGAMTICTSVMQLCLMPIMGICQGGQPIISYNYGAGKIDRVKKAVKLQIIVCLSATFILWFFVQNFPGVFVGVFNDDPELVSTTVWALGIYTKATCLMGLQLACQQTFMALGKAKTSLLLACLRKIILLIPLIFILPNFFSDKVFAVFLAEPVADFIAITVTSIIFFVMYKKDLAPKKEG